MLYPGSITTDTNLYYKWDSGNCLMFGQRYRNYYLIRRVPVRRSRYKRWSSSVYLLIGILNCPAVCLGRTGMLTVSWRKIIDIEKLSPQSYFLCFTNPTRICVLLLNRRVFVVLLKYFNGRVNTLVILDDCTKWPRLWLVEKCNSLQWMRLLNISIPVIGVRIFCFGFTSSRCSRHKSVTASMDFIGFIGEKAEAMFLLNFFEFLPRLSPRHYKSLLQIYLSI